jgi:autotransporter strand-loop-strand O-heptosyltransferase
MGNSPPDNIIDKTGDFSIEDRMVDLKHADMFIGIGSGLSWLSWAVGTPTVLISGFSAPFCEPQEGIERLHNPDVCNSCFNDPSIQFDPGDWNWCPRNKDFECSKAITPEIVIKSINKIIERSS